MGRIYKKKLGSRPYKNYTEMHLQRAVLAVRRQQLTCKEAADLFQIPKRTIYNKVHERHMKNVGAPEQLTAVEERHIVDVLLASAEFGSPLKAFDLRILVKRYLDKAGKKIRKFPDNMPGNDWSLNFIDRHKDKLTQRVCTNIKTARAEKTEDEISSYFDNLEKTMRGVPAENVLNYDETNLSDDPGSQKCIFRRGTKYPERSMNSTKSSISLMFAISGDGESLPPYVVYKAERIYDLWTVGGPPGTRYNRSKSGWFDAYIFEDWFNSMALPWAKKKIGKKVIIGDNLSSHLNIDIIVSCQRNNISFAFLPPNSTHLTQPLDVGYYGPLKRVWRQILTKYKTRNPRDSALNKCVFPGLLRQLVDELALKDVNNIKSAFRATGIIPFDRLQVIKKLPNQRLEENVARRIDESLLEYLQEMRSPSTSKKGRKKMVKVAPGKSVAVEDMENHDEPINAGTSQDNLSETQRNDSDVGENFQADENEPEECMSERSNDETEKEAEQDESLPEKPKVDDYVVVAFPTRKNKRHYVGRIVEFKDNDYIIKFLRIRNPYIFTFPNVDDISLVSEEDIVKRLKPPRIKCRGMHEFDTDLSCFKNIG